MNTVNPIIILMAAIVAFIGLGFVTTTGADSTDHARVGIWDEEDSERTGMGATEPDVEPEPEPEPEPMPDPGHVWATLKNAVTGETLTATECELWAVATGENLRPFRACFVPFNEKTGPIDLVYTDSNGVTDILLPEAEPRLDVIDRLGDAVSRRMAIPVPVGWQPVFNLLAVARQVETESKVTLKFKPIPSISGKVVDTDGKDVEGAVVFAWPVEVSSIMKPWGGLHSEILLQQEVELASRETEEAWLQAIRDYQATPMRTENDPDLRKLAQIPEGWLHLARHFRQVIGTDGYHLKGLFNGKWKIATYFKGGDLQVREIALDGRPETTDFTLLVPPRARYTIVCEAGSYVNFKLARCDDTGIPLTDERFEFSWSVGDEPTVLTLVEHGFYRLFAAGEVFKTSLVFESKAGEDTELKIRFSLEHEPNKLSVAMTAAGENLDGVFFYSDGGEPIAIPVNAEPLNPPVGEYTVWMRGQKPQMISFAESGSKLHVLRTEVPMADVTIKVSDKFKELAPAPISLILTDLSVYQQTQKTYEYSLDSASTDATLPEGAYKWELKAEGIYVSGRILFGAATPTTFIVDPERLPGYRMFSVKCFGYEESGLPDVQLIAPFKDMQMADIRVGDSAFESGSQVAIAAATPVFKIVRQNEILFIAPEGHYRLQITDGDQTELRAAKIPGLATVKSGNIKTTQTATITIGLKEEDTARHGQTTIFHHELGWFKIDVPEAGQSSKIEVPLGKCTVYTSSYNKEHALSFGRYTFQHKAGGVEFEFGKFRKDKPAILRLTCKGLGHPLIAGANWWHTFGRQPVPVRLENMETGVTLWLWIPDELSVKDGRERSFNLLLPEGKYQVVPWPFADAKTIKKTSLNSGKKRQITIKGTE
ncbi:MAG: hypothetical protein L3J82_02540 [Planctomycetes bacterium]|nr:hypothetical protein [Planctomycetota bacterium]